MESPITARAALLQTLAAGDGFGLELIERVRVCTAGVVNLHQGSAYPALRALEREGLVTSREVQGPAERGGRPRIYYRLTAAGRKAAAKDRETMAALAGLGLSRER